jgi:cyclopropane-fatty-acyl-phospholipid synthase
MIEAMATALLQRGLSALVRRGRLQVQTPTGRVLEFGDGGQPQVRLRFTDARAMLALMLDPDLQLGQLFMDGRLQVQEGTIYDVLVLLLRDARGVEPGAAVQALDALRMRTRHWLQRNRPARARANVAHHYDLDERLYSLFLDSEWQYSCAYFSPPDITLDEAQRAKQRHIAAKLLLEPGQRVLDIGCGWGGLSRYLVRVGAAGQATGITLSTEQHTRATQVAAASADAARLAYRLQDYRDTARLEPGAYDRIVSVGMFEHVGLGHHDDFFRACHRLLNDNGVMLLHFIGNSDVPDFNNPWIEKYIFPGGHIPALSECMPAIERSGLIVTDIEVLRLHYAQTLRLWRERFMARRDEARALYDERFCRMWEFYLSMSEAAFRHQEIAVFQIQLARRQDAVPLTRDYVAERERALREREASLASQAIQPSGDQA